FGELFFGDLWCVVWGYGGMRTHFSLLNPSAGLSHLTRTGVTTLCLRDVIVDCLDRLFRARDR
ncbi:hypothetical protein CYJ43_09700, partial [Corynebacterium amycolatum]